MPGRLDDRDVDAVTYAFVARARPARAGRPGFGRAIPKTSPLAEARSWYQLALSLDPVDSVLQKRLFEVDAAIERDAKRIEAARTRD